MANPRRKMVTVRRIDGVSPIDGADRIELAHVGGWQVVVGKGEYKAGDLAAYYEIDSFLPADDERYTAFQSETPKEMLVDGRPIRGSVLRTRKFRGAYSQGLLLRPKDVLPETIPASAYERMCERNNDISGLVNVREYVTLQPMNAGFTGKYDPYSCGPRTDAERIQNVSKGVWDLVKRTTYQCSIKVDGTSISMVFDDRTNGMTFYSHNNRFDMTSPGIPKIVYECAERQGLIDFCERNHMTSVQAELVGPKIQGNRLSFGEHRLMVFSVWSVGLCRYLDPYQTFLDFGDERTRSALVPRLDIDLKQFGNPQDFLAWVDGIKGNVTKGRLDEGVVVHIFDRGDLTNNEWLMLQNELGPTVQCKAVSNRYLLKAKE